MGWNEFHRKKDWLDGTPDGVLLEYMEYMNQSGLLYEIELAKVPVT